MLPRPAISSKRSYENSTVLESGRANSSSPLRFHNLHRWTKRAFARSRLTNLGTVILITVCIILLFGNWRFWLAQRDRRSRSNQRPVNLESGLTQGTFHDASHLVVVAGHAIWKGCHSSSWKDEDNWVLQDHQRSNRNVESFYSHILKGIELYKADPSAVLIFSGGVTRIGHPTQSEGQSYLALSLSNGLLKDGDRAFTEDFALDSFQNLLFSIARYHELAVASGVPSSAAWPSKITVIGFEMKRRRFVELHRRALKFPDSQFEYLGVDFADETSREIGWEGENKFGYQPYVRDLYGCSGELAAKRVSRNPYARFHPYHYTNPELSDLFDWCPSRQSGHSALHDPSALFPGPLPWTSQTSWTPNHDYHD